MQPKYTTLGHKKIRGHPAARNASTTPSSKATHGSSASLGEWTDKGSNKQLLDYLTKKWLVYAIQKKCCYKNIQKQNGFEYQNIKAAIPSVVTPSSKHKQMINNKFNWSTKNIITH